MKTEIWKDIPGYEGLYQVSNLGNVKSLDKISINNKGSFLRYGVLLQYNIVQGYNHISLYKNGKRKICKLHRLVAETFILNPDNKPQVNHKDGNKQNNCVDNLEWNTAKENIIHSFKILGHKTIFQINHPTKGKFGKYNHLSKKINQYDKKGNFIKTWDCMADVERQLGIKGGHISCVCKGRRKTHGGYIWKYL